MTLLLRLPYHQISNFFTAHSNCYYQNNVIRTKKFFAFIRHRSRIFQRNENGTFLYNGYIWKDWNCMHNALKNHSLFLGNIVYFYLFFCYVSTLKFITHSKHIPNGKSRNSKDYDEPWLKSAHMCSECATLVFIGQKWKSVEMTLSLFNHHIHKRK